MKEPSPILVIIVVVCALVMLLAGLYLLAKFNILFRKQIRYELLRKNLVVWLVALCLFLSVVPFNPSFYAVIQNKMLLHFFMVQVLCITLEVVVIFNATWLILQYAIRKGVVFRKRMAIALCSIIVTATLMSFPIIYIARGNFKEIQTQLVYNFYIGCITGLIYITMDYVDADRKRKLSEKELEVLRLQELKTKAELDALHSKVNPHFLYNALNSIADLSITNGKKARQMTIELADLFRYSINYSNNNYSTVTDEVAMTGIYLEIEKIRFEDQLSYTVNIEEGTGHYLLPRFLLQPLAENAVKHGLKITGKMTEILLEVKKEGNVLIINISDNGPLFPDELIPGYGVKSVYDKLDILFHDQYQVLFSNHPRKQVSVHLYKLMKNEPV